MQNRPEKKKSNGMSLIWAMTFLAVLVIIGGSVFIALNKYKTSTPPAPLQPEIMPLAQEPESVPEPEPEAVLPEEPQIEMKQQSEASIDYGEGSVRLQLDRLAGTLKLHLPFMERRNKIPLEYTCYRQNKSPEMEWEGAPPGTKSFVVFMERREKGDAEDAFVNWILFDIPGDRSGLTTGQPKTAFLPDGSRHAKADHGNFGYTGPCDSKGKFHYTLRVFALDKVLEVPSEVSKENLIRTMNGHIIDAAEQSFIHYYRL